MDSYTCINKFAVDDKILYFKLYWKNNVNDLFTIKIFDGESSWTGRYSHEFAQKYMQRVVETEEEYHNNVKTALSGRNNVFIYEFLKDSGDTVAASFRWKKRYESSGSGTMPPPARVHGSVPVHLDDSPESKDILIDFLIEENDDLRKVIKKFTTRNDYLVSDLAECKTKLEKFIDIKTSLETSLYGKFVQLLNSKKRKIQLLEGNLQKFEETSMCNDLD